MLLIAPPEGRVKTPTGEQGTLGRRHEASGSLGELLPFLENTLWILLIPDLQM